MKMAAMSTWRVPAIDLINKWVRSFDTSNQYTFTENLCAGCTANQHMLLATQSFADLPGAPTPDHIFDPKDVPFFDNTGDQLKYWTYGFGDWTFAAVPTV